VLRDAVRRLALIYAGVLGTTIVLSLLIGLAAGAHVSRSVAIGCYVGGAALLAGCFVVGVRGPLRGVSGTGETVPLFGARSVRRASAEERSEASWTAVALFLLGLSLVVIGALLDPAHRTF
jgi:hypothetical protein